MTQKTKQNTVKPRPTCFTAAIRKTKEKKKKTSPCQPSALPRTQALGLVLFHSFVCVPHDFVKYRVLTPVVRYGTIGMIAVIVNNIVVVTA